MLAHARKKNKKNILINEIFFDGCALISFKEHMICITGVVI